MQTRALIITDTPKMDVKHSSNCSGCDTCSIGENVSKKNNRNIRHRFDASTTHTRYNGAITEDSPSTNCTVIKRRNTNSDNRVLVSPPKRTRNNGGQQEHNDSTPIQCNALVVFKPNSSSVPKYHLSTNRSTIGQRYRPLWSTSTILIYSLALLAVVVVVAALSGSNRAGQQQQHQQKHQQQVVKVMLIRANKTHHHHQQQQHQHLQQAQHQAPQRQQNQQQKRNAPPIAEMITTRAPTSSAPIEIASLTSLTLHEHPSGAASSSSPPTAAAVLPPGAQQVATGNSGLGVEVTYMEKMRPTWLTSSLQYKMSDSQLRNTTLNLMYQAIQLQAFDSPILLRTKLGIIEGVRSIKFNKRLYSFLSVPYAKPPVGELRFRAPQPAESWQGIYQATKWPPFCVQSSMTLASRSSPVHVLSPSMNEDCLYLNIWSPSLKVRKNNKRPVMVWFHGGAFQYGGVSVDENDGSALALLGDVVVVTLNYRLNVFGFLNANNQEQAPNNVGLMDQRMALQWVQDNIKSFGGDPQHVTIFGESAGGHSVGLHMISPESYKLFKRAILQSGVPTSFLRSYDVTDRESTPAVTVARRLGCQPGGPAASMEPTSGDQIERTGEDPLVNGKRLTSPVQNGASETFGDRLAKREQSSDEAPPTVTITTNATSATTGDDEGGDNPEEEDENELLLDDATMECIRNKSSAEILNALGPSGAMGFFPSGNDKSGFFPNGPIQDSFDSENLKIGPQKEFLIGVNPDEGAFMLHYGMPNLFPSKSEPRVSNIEELKSALSKEIERLSAVMGAKNGTVNKNNIHAHLYKPFLRTSTTMINRIMPKYNGSSFNPPLGVASAFGKGVASLITDIIFLCPARTMSTKLAEAKRSIYFYLFNHRSSQTQYHPWMGITHHDEVEFVFGRPLRMADTYSGLDVEMSQRMIKLWSHFAYTGQMLDQFNTTWPKYGAEDNYYMELNADHVKVGSRYHDYVCNIYDTVISVHLN